MPELVAVLGLVMLIVGASSVEIMPWPTLVESGNQAMLHCTALGIPLEVFYFSALGLALTLSGQRPTGWFWRPFNHHDLLSEHQKLLVLPFYYAGALSFGGIVLSILTVVLGMLGAIHQG